MTSLHRIAEGGAHTPGPWKVITDATAREVEVFEIAEVSHLRIICDGRGDGFAAAGGPHEDARLIAAAPDLYAALRVIVDSSERGHAAILSPLLEAARAALAKVEQQ